MRERGSQNNEAEGGCFRALRQVLKLRLADDVLPDRQVDLQTLQAT